MCDLSTHATKGSTIKSDTELDSLPLESSGKVKSCWESLIRHISEGYKVDCKAVPKELPLIHREITYFPTGSSYEGEWSILGMSGRGIYTFPNGVRYEGEFDDGDFHGEGKMFYPSGCVLEGKWAHGEMTERKLTFANGLVYQEDKWPYCKMPDRRFNVEVDNGIKPAGESYLTADAPTPEIPLGKYDTGDGFFDPANACISVYDNPAKVTRGPAKKEQNWIRKTNRYSPMRPLGPQEQQLYENWQEIMQDLPGTIGKITLIPEVQESTESEQQYEGLQETLLESPSQRSSKAELTTPSTSRNLFKEYGYTVQRSMQTLESSSDLRKLEKIPLRLISIHTNKQNQTNI